MQNELTNCPQCGKLFVRTSRMVCQDCWEQQEFEVRLVQQWMKQNPGSTLGQISDATEVPMKRISEYIRSNRIIVEQGGASTAANCQACGAPIVSGSFCRGCLDKLGGGSGDNQSSSSQIRPPSEHISSHDRESGSAIRKFKR